MVYSEIALIAFLLLVVFAGVQIKELVCTIMSNYFNKNNQPIPPRTVLPAATLSQEIIEEPVAVEMPRRVAKSTPSAVKKKKSMPVKKKTKATTAKTTSAKKKTITKKTTTKKTVKKKAS